MCVIYKKYESQLFFFFFLSFFISLFIFSIFFNCIMSPNQSISGLFQELFTSNKKPNEEFEGSDFKRLLHKNKKSPSNYSISSMASGSSSRIHKDSPDYNSIIYLNHSPAKRRFNLFSLFGQHEDRYFNSSRDELSKDMFPNASWCIVTQPPFFLFLYKNEIKKIIPLEACFDLNLQK